MKIDFTDQVVVVTGATRGIGSQLANDFSNLGARLILTGTKEEEVEALNEVAVKDGKSRKKYYCADFTDGESTAKFVKDLRAYERIDVCVNNAGINRLNYIDETRLEDWDDMIAVNLKAPFMITREVSKVMKKNLYGRIINISSLFGVISREKRSIYSASKFGIRGLTMASSNELARYNVLVNAVSPGFVLTELTRRNLTEEEMEKLVGEIPMRRLATPDEISRVVLFLASTLNTYLTGQNIIVDGGYVNV